MKKVTMSIALLAGIFLSNLIFAADYNATGLWDYSQTSHSNNCGEPNPGTTIYGLAGILQSGDSFLFVDLYEGFSTYGSINGATYNFIDYFCEDFGVVTTNAQFTLSSATRASGPVNWGWTDGQNSCSGGFQLDLTKQPQNTPIYDASGKWNYTQSGFDHQTCPSAPPHPAPSGYFQVTQTGNSVTAVDDQGVKYDGFIDGDIYGLVTTKLVGQARTTTVYRIKLNSASKGSGDGEFVWDDNCTDCWGDWTIDVTKEEDAKANPGMPILLLED